MLVGLDLDNTVIQYDAAFVHAVQERGLLDIAAYAHKQHIRDAVRALPNGDYQWQALQGQVYGRGIVHASLFPGVHEFLTGCIAQGHAVHIVSHKTQYGHHDPARIDLHEAALGFLESQGLFASGLLQRQQVHFLPSRSDKVNMIATLRPDWFIDDLVEVYQEPHFPDAIQKILFHFDACEPVPGPWRCCSSWQEIAQEILGPSR